ncbi:MAG: rod shape-determining protein MreD [Candidatus Acidiferrales bacterium]
MASMLNTRLQSGQNIEVHKFYSGSVVLVSFVALILQAFLHKYGRWAEVVDLPLLIVIYFGVSRRNPITGLLLGAAIGIFQDGLSHDNPIGLYGIAKTLVGYLASTIGAHIDTDHPVARFVLTFAFFHFHQCVLAFTARALLNQSAPYFNLHLLIDSLISAAVAVFLFAALDRLRKSS